jgi:acylphosphatase
MDDINFSATRLQPLHYSLQSCVLSVCVAHKILVVIIANFTLRHFWFRVIHIDSATASITTKPLRKNKQMPLKALHLTIHGRVQGVGYRAWTVSRAKQLGLNGWVRNRNDGTVEAVIAGENEAVELMVQECWEGSLSAQVDNIVINKWVELVPPGFLSRETI